jgi:hypothetical protein
MRAELRRRGVDASHLVTVEIRLLDPPGLEADLAQGRKADTLHNVAFEVRPDAIGIDDGVEGGDPHGGGLIERAAIEG